MLFINTRPQTRAQALNQYVQQAGYQVFDYPLLELVEHSYSDEMAELYAQFEYSQVVVVVSPTAAELGLKYLARSGLTVEQVKPLQWVAIGQATANVLARAGIDAQVPRLETSEGILELAAFSSPTPLKQVAFWRGEGGRQFMMQHLQQQGVQLLNFNLYHRQCPENAQRQKNVLQTAVLNAKRQVAVLISSEASWLNWCMLLEANPLICHIKCYIVLGERLFQLVHTDKIRFHADFEVCQIHNLKPETVVAALQGIER